MYRIKSSIIGLPVILKKQIKTLHNILIYLGLVCKEDGVFPVMNRNNMLTN